MLANILLINDNDHQHELFRCYAMMSDDIELNHATDLEEAAGMIAKTDLDLIFLDDRLHPYGDFRETVPVVRKAGYREKIVLISSDVEHPIFWEADDHTVYACMDKSDFSLEKFPQQSR